MRFELSEIKAKAQLVEKSVIFRAIAPLAFVIALGINVYSKVKYQALLQELIDAITKDVVYGTHFEKMTMDRVYPEMSTLHIWGDITTVILWIVGLILLVWLAWLVSNFAATKGFSKRQYFWLSIVISPLIPWLIALASKPSNTQTPVE